MIGRLLKPPGPEHPIAVKAKQRIDRVPKDSALMWADTVGARMARSLSDYQRTGNDMFLVEAEDSALAMLGCVASLKERDKAIG